MNIFKKLKKEMDETKIRRLITVSPRVCDNFQTFNNLKGTNMSATIESLIRDYCIKNKAEANEIMEVKKKYMKNEI